MYRVQLFLGLDVVEHVGVANVLEDLGLPAVELAPFGSRELAERLAEDRGHLHDDDPVGTLRRFGPLYHFDWLAAHGGTLTARRSSATYLIATDGLGAHWNANAAHAAGEVKLSRTFPVNFAKSLPGLIFHVSVKHSPVRRTAASPEQPSELGHLGIAPRPDGVQIAFSPFRAFAVELALALFLPLFLVDRREPSDDRVPIGDPEQADGVAG